MSEKSAKTRLLDMIWRRLLYGKETGLPEELGEENENYYLRQILRTLEDYGGITGMVGLDAVRLPNPITAPIYIGDDTNRAIFDADGYLHFEGTARGWRDELQPLISSAAVVTPSNDIIRNSAEGSLTFKTSARFPTDYVGTEHQLNHDWDAGTNIHPHLHWWQISANYPNWLLQYRWQKMGAAKTTSWTTAVVAEHVFTYTSGTLNQISEFTEITPPEGYGEVSDIVQYKIFRDVTNVSTVFAGADPESSDVDALNFDSHIRIDSLGSDEEYE